MLAASCQIKSNANKEIEKQLLNNLDKTLTKRCQLLECDDFRQTKKLSKKAY